MIDNIITDNIITDNIIKDNIINTGENKYDSSIITTNKLSANKWNLIEKPLLPSEKLRNQIILNLGEDISTNNELNNNSLTTIGDYYYFSLRDELKDIIELPKIEKNKSKNEIKINSKTRTILNSTQENINKKIINLKKMLKDNPENKIYTDLMTGYNFVEFRVLILMKVIEYYSGNFNNDISEKEEILLGSKKIINLLKTINENKDNKFEKYFKKICNIENFNINLSSQLIIDL